MWIFKKEKKSIEHIVQHLLLVDRCVEESMATLAAWMEGDAAGMEAHCEQASRTESEADETLYQLRELLFSGAYLPTIRGNLYRLLEQTDQIANAAEHFANLLSREHPHIPESLHHSLHLLAGTTRDTVSAQRSAMEMYFDPKGELDPIRELTHLVREREHHVDEIEEEFTRTLFASKLALAEKLHLKQLLRALVQITDVTEDAADALDVVAIRSVV